MSTHVNDFAQKIAALLESDPSAPKYVHMESSPDATRSFPNRDGVHTMYYVGDLRNFKVTIEVAY